MKSIETKAVHLPAMEKRSIQPKSMPIYQTSVFSFSSLEEMNGYYDGNGTYLYTRTANPNTDALAEAVAKLEEAPAGVTAASGTGAILAGILAVVQHGDHILAAQDLYGGTLHLLGDELKRFGITVHFTDFSSISSVEQLLLNEPAIKLVYSESITNPFLRVENVNALGKLKAQYGVKLMIDNTFATPYITKPYEDGADLIVHSGTKYLGGHSDATSGVLVGEEELIAEAAKRVVNMGLNLSPFEAWLTLRGIKTLALRMKAQMENARAIAEFLTGKMPVWYPGVGAIVTFELPDNIDVEQFFAALDWIGIVPSLAGVETTVSYPYGTSHRELSEEEKIRLGVTKRVVRLSAGIEGTDDIIRQLSKAIGL